MNWDHINQDAQNQVDSMLMVLKDVKAGEEVCIIVDRVYRPYVQWLYSARRNGVEAEDARNSVINLVNGMILETMTQMASRSEDKVVNPKEWIEDFFNDLLTSLKGDLDRIQSGVGRH